MADISPLLNNVQRQAENKARQAGPWVEKAARIGYAAKGIVYLIIGFLALEAASHHGGRMTNSRGALEAIYQQPFGQFLLGLVGLGLAGYAVWRFIEAWLDVENKGSDAKGIATRIGYIISGAAYGVLAYTAFQLIYAGSQANSGNGSVQDWTAWVMSNPFGQALVGIVGLVIIGLGLAQMYRGYRADFGDKLNRSEIPAAQWNAAVWSGRFGYAARGVVFAIVGGFILEAAINANARQAKGLGSALDLLSEQPYGPWLLAIVAIGLMAYGLFMLVEARYRRIAI